MYRPLYGISRGFSKGDRSNIILYNYIETIQYIKNGAVLWKEK